MKLSFLVILVIVLLFICFMWLVVVVVGERRWKIFLLWRKVFLDSVVLVFENVSTR